MDNSIKLIYSITELNLNPNIYYFTFYLQNIVKLFIRQMLQDITKRKRFIMVYKNDFFFLFTILTEYVFE